MTSTIVSSREDSEELTSSESFESIHDALVGSQDIFLFVIIEEILDFIWAKFDNVSCSVWISDEVWLNTELKIIISRVTPQNINNQLLLRSRDFMDNFKWSFNLFDLLKTIQGTSYTSMKTHNFVINDSTKWKPVKDIVNSIEHRVRISWIFT